MPTRGLAVIFLLATALRLGYALAVHPDGLIWGDETTYDRIAWQLAQTGAYVSHPYDAAPGWPATLAALYTMVGHSYTAARVLQAILGGVLALAVAGTGVLCFGRTTGLLAGLGVALYPPLLYLAAVLYADHLGAVLLACSVWSLVWWRSRRDHVPLVVAGLLLGATALTRPGYLVLLPVAVLYVAVEARRQQRVRQAVLLAGLAAATIAPWTVRNAIVFDHFLPVSTGLGLHLWRGNNELSRGDSDDRHLLPLNEMWQARVAALEPERQAVVLRQGRHLAERLEQVDGVEQDAILRHEALRHIRQRPARFAALSLRRLETLHSPFSRTVTTTDAGSARNRLIAALSLIPVLAFGVVGAVLAWRARRSSWIVHATILAPTLLYASLTAATRFRLPLDPLWILLAAVPLALLLERLVPRLRRT